MDKIISAIMAVVMTLLSFFGVNFGPDEDQTTTTTQPTSSTVESTTQEDPSQTTTKVEESSTQEESSQPSSTQTSTTLPDTTQDGTTGSEEGETSLPKEYGILGFKWDEEDQCFCSAHNAWQRYFGYNKYYDFFAQMVVIYIDTVRIKFNYEGRDWMIQLWKGQYGFVLMGAEVGIYYKNENESVEHYTCADDENLFKMGYTCFSYDEVLFTRTYRDSWWLTGFVPGKLDKFADRSQLAVKLRITLRDKGMRNAFIKALSNPACGFRRGNAKDDDTFLVLGNDVYLMWRSNRDLQTD